MSRDTNIFVAPQKNVNLPQRDPVFLKSVKLGGRWNPLTPCNSAISRTMTFELINFIQQPENFL